MKAYMSALLCDLGGARTHDPLIKSQLLYQLSYEVSPKSPLLANVSAKVRFIFVFCKILNKNFSQPSTTLHLNSSTTLHRNASKKLKRNSR